MACEISWYRIKTKAQALCHFRNKNLPAELGQASVACLPDAFIFSQAIYPVDSRSPSEQKEVAKLICLKGDAEHWGLYIRQENYLRLDLSQSEIATLLLASKHHDLGAWIFYPPSEFMDEEALVQFIAQDPQGLIW